MASVAIASRATPISVHEATRKLLHYCRTRDWAGHDPYDALNSELFRAFPSLDRRLPRLVLTQLLKRSPVNLRHLLRIPETQNPKALGLFLASVLRLQRLGVINDLSLADQLVGRIVDLRAQGHERWCWGYSFPWQTRTEIVPRGAPNLVCTTFVAGALLDAYEELRGARYAEMAVSAAEYMLRDLYWSEGEAAGFGYPLSHMRQQVHNANLLAAALFCRISAVVGEKKFGAPALKAARFSAGKQRADGSWLYGEMPNQAWIDNFHTGYNLCALRSIARDAGTREFDSHLRQGMKFYRQHFFRPDGAPKYFHDRAYPLDTHCVAQSIITLLAFRDYDEGHAALAQAVFGWAMSHLWDDRGFFYYRVLPFCTIRTSYMRWSQAWMLLALSILLEEGNPDGPSVVVHRKPSL
ncbi:MAG: hypothetical protein JO069_05735 [Verrucomicrobia bacterium]|nr:hypothetical protein [Verrucomicrobiota bacterium]